MNEEEQQVQDVLDSLPNPWYKNWRPWVVAAIGIGVAAWVLWAGHYDRVPKAPNKVDQIEQYLACMVKTKQNGEDLCVPLDQAIQIILEEQRRLNSKIDALQPSP